MATRIIQGQQFDGDPNQLDLHPEGALIIDSNTGTVTIGNGVDTSGTQISGGSASAGASIGAINSLGVLEVDYAQGVISVSHTEDITAIQFTNAQANQKNEVIIILTQDGVGSRTITTAGYVTAGSLGLDISLVQNAVNIITFLTVDGSTHYGFSNGKNFG
jgi:hypothetical protein